MSTRNITAGLVLAAAGVFVMNQTLGWAWSEMLDWLKDGFSGKSQFQDVFVHWPNIVGVILILIGILVLFGDKIFKREQPPIVRPSKPTSQGLYVGSIAINQDLLIRSKTIQITARCYNGTANTIYLETVAGRIGVQQIIIGMIYKQYQLTDVASKDTTRNRTFEPQAEFDVTFETLCSDELFTAISRVTDTSFFLLVFSDLRIVLRSREWSDAELSLPIWTAAELRNGEGRLVVERQKKAS